VFVVRSLAFDKGRGEGWEAARIAGASVRWNARLRVADVRLLLPSYVRAQKDREAGAPPGLYAAYMP